MHADHWEEAAPAVGSMQAAASKGHTEVVRQLLLLEPADALGAINCGSAFSDPLHQAALGGHAAAFMQLLPLAPDAINHLSDYWFQGDSWQWSLLHSAAEGGAAAVVEALLQLAPDAPGWQTSGEHLPLHVACACGNLEAARLLLQAAPQTAAAVDEYGDTPLHFAVGSGDAAIATLLFEAAPESALVESALRHLPLHVALSSNASPLGWRENPDAARMVLLASGLSPSRLLDALRRPATSPSVAQPLYADLASACALSDAEWQRVPAPCPGLARALPAVLERSAVEAAQLVQRLPADERERLSTAALALARMQRCHCIALPAPLLRACLLQCLAD